MPDSTSTATRTREGHTGGRLTRDALVRLCEEAVAVNVADWSGPRTGEAIGEVGLAWALLKAGCAFRETQQPAAGERALVLEVQLAPGGNWRACRLPTPLALAEAGGADWSCQP